MKWENYFKIPKKFNMWPADLKSIELRGGINFTELWMIKERFDAGHLKSLAPPEAVWQHNGRYNALYGDEAGTYCFCTEGSGSPLHEYVKVIRINKLTPEHASKLLSGWPYGE